VPCRDLAELSTEPQSATSSAALAFCSTKQDRGALLFLQAPHDREDLADQLGERPSEALVHQDQPRRRHQGTTDREHPLLAARHQPGRLALRSRRRGK
jgi:hypothetical protein